MRYLRNKDGSAVDAVTMFMTNGDKIAEAAKGLFSEVRGMIADGRKAQSDDLAARKDQLDYQNQQIAQAERLTKILERKAMLDKGILPPDATGIVPPAPEPPPPPPPPAPSAGVPQGARNMAEQFAAWGGSTPTQ